MTNKFKCSESHRCRRWKRIPEPWREGSASVFRSAGPVADSDEAETAARRAYDFSLPTCTTSASIPSYALPDVPLYWSLRVCADNYQRTDTTLSKFLLVTIPRADGCVWMDGLLNESSVTIVTEAGHRAELRRQSRIELVRRQLYQQPLSTPSWHAWYSD